MNLRQIARIVLFAYLCFIAIFSSLWCITILPEIIQKNMGFSSVKEQTKIAGSFYTSFFYGLIIGSFIWPTATNYFQKRNLLFFGMLIQGIFATVVGVYNNMWWMIFCRFMMGLMHNVSTVGKSFIFEFSEPSYQQYAYNVKSCFGVLGSFIGPYIGFFLYQLSGQSFLVSNFYVGGNYLIGLILYIFVFYIDYKPGEIEEKVARMEELKRLELPDEEQDLLLKEKNLIDIQKKTEKKKGRGLIKVFITCIKDSEIRGLILIYIIANGVFKTVTIISVFFVEQKWEDDGLGVSNETMSLAIFICYFPSVIILMSGPKFVPSILGYTTFIKIITGIFSFAILCLPFLRDFFTKLFIHRNLWTIFINIIFLNAFNPKLFSPFVNFLLNKKIRKEDRTALNSISFILSTMCSSILINIASWLYSASFNLSFFIQFRPYNNYASFLFLFILLWMGICLLKKIHLKNNLN